MCTTPFDPGHPVVCVDERPYQLLAHAPDPIPATRDATAGKTPSMSGAGRVRSSSGSVKPYTWVLHAVPEQYLCVGVLAGRGVAQSALLPAPSASIACSISFRSSKACGCEPALTSPDVSGLCAARNALHGTWCERICAALERHDGSAAQAEIDRDMREGLTCFAGIGGASRLLRRWQPTLTNHSFQQS